MHISRLSLTNFRNYGRLEVNLPTGPILLHGDNAQGKTNFLEAIFYLATSRSPAADQDQQLLNWHAGQPDDPLVVGRLVADVTVDDTLPATTRQIEMRLIREQQQGRTGFRREALINRRKVRLMDLLGQLRVVLFLPQDINLITGPPSGRRRYLDVTLCQLDRDYCGALSRYNKVLEQRNAQLRQIAETGRGHDVLPVFTDRLITLGSLLYARRAALLAGLTAEAARIYYEELTGRSETLQLHYLPRLDGNGLKAGEPESAARALASEAAWLAGAGLPEIGDRFRSALAAAQGVDLAQARTTVGPHRDDWRAWINGRALSSFGSRGQQRSALLALKLAEIDWIERITGERPVLLLDEVAAELDEKRRRLLLQYVLRAPQAVVTATELGMFAETFLARATRFHVVHGQLEERTEPQVDYE